MTKPGAAPDRQNVRVRTDLLDELRMAAARSNRPLIHLVEEAIREYIDRPRKTNVMLRVPRVPLQDGERAGGHAFDLPDDEEPDTHDARATR